MNYNQNTTTTLSTNNYTDIKNKGFLILDTIFRENNWQLIKNEMNMLSYSKFGYETSSFDIKISSDKIIVSVPLKNSIYQYVTTFKNYFEASEYVEQRFREYIE